ncbi:hypothetical protein LGT39_04300 [Demequina sp. TTPB684]|uniref:hypothetical protein n=1 Tax=unclassified Demequina TaxID=2620311 RepID=UPI001CF0F265|nr:MULTISPECIES: hypothetical protein [unclassified Demequina]MCB2412069.1 hypothetical protein [Demequina sp. TTPB684]UPU88523.1 hypothetical protein LGT36_000940 [Demequina sp. TMPB413]
MRLIPGAHVLTRGEHSIQVGSRDPLVVIDPTVHERRFLERLDSAAATTPLERARCAPLIERLAAAGLLDQHSAHGAKEPPRATLNDGGPIGCGIGLNLARAGWSVTVNDVGRAVETPRGTYDPGSLAATRQAAAADTIRRLLPHSDVHSGPSHFDVAVIVAHGAPLIEAAVPLMAGDIPHLYVTTDEHGARIGPLVIPGKGACGTCVGLARSAADPLWPELALQLTARRTRPQCAADATAQIVALSVAALEWWRSTRDPDAGADALGPSLLAGGEAAPAAEWLNTVWTIDSGRPPVPTPAPAQPDCGCGATGPVGDELAARRARMHGAS